MFYRPGREMVNVDPLFRAEFVADDSELPSSVSPSIAESFTSIWDDERAR